MKRTKHKPGPTVCGRGHEARRDKRGKLQCNVCRAISQGRTPPGSKSGGISVNGRFQLSR